MSVMEQMTQGQRMCGVSFNPGQREDVDFLKRLFGTAVDEMLRLRDEATDPEVARLASIAITETQTAQMWAVKAVTWNS